VRGQIEDGLFKAIFHDVVLPNVHPDVVADVEVTRVDVRRDDLPARRDALG
jgi:hypothetical protein